MNAVPKNWRQVIETNIDNLHLLLIVCKMLKIKWMVIRWKVMIIDLFYNRWKEMQKQFINSTKKNHHKWRQFKLLKNQTLPLLLMMLRVQIKILTWRVLEVSIKSQKLVIEPIILLDVECIFFKQKKTQNLKRRRFVLSQHKKKP